MHQEYIYYEPPAGQLIARIGTPEFDIVTTPFDYIARYFEVVQGADGNLEKFADTCDDLITNDYSRDELIARSIGDAEILGIIDENGEFWVVDESEIKTQGWDASSSS